MKKLKISNEDFVTQKAHFLDLNAKTFQSGLQREVATTPPTLHAFDSLISRSTFDAMPAPVRQRLKDLANELFEIQIMYGKHEDGSSFAGTVENG